MGDDGIRLPMTFQKSEARVRLDADRKRARGRTVRPSLMMEQGVKPETLMCPL